MVGILGPPGLCTTVAKSPPRPYHTVCSAPANCSHYALPIGLSVCVPISVFDTPCEPLSPAGDVDVIFGDTLSPSPHMLSSKPILNPPMCVSPRSHLPVSSPPSLFPCCMRSSPHTGARALLLNETSELVTLFKWVLRALRVAWDSPHVPDCSNCSVRLTSLLFPRVWAPLHWSFTGTQAPCSSLCSVFWGCPPTSPLHYGQTQSTLNDLSEFVIMYFFSLFVLPTRTYVSERAGVGSALCPVEDTQQVFLNSGGNGGFMVSMCAVAPDGGLWSGSSQKW